MEARQGILPRFHVSGSEGQLDPDCDSGSLAALTGEHAMYVSQHIFTPVPQRLAQWTVYNRNYMSLTARVPGASLSRILRCVEAPERFVAIGIWSDH